MNKKILTIVTVCYNSEKTIRKTIESILNQTFNEYEYIFIDGLSKDKTNDIIRSYKKSFELKGIPIIHISEKDNGIYDAMNKGANLANGEWIIYMNSDDYFFEDNTLSKVFENRNYSNVDVIFGDTCFWKEDNNYIEKAKEINTIKKHAPFCSQSVFVRTNLQKEYKFNCKYKISADYDFFVRLYLDKKIFLKIDQVISNFSLEGISNSNLIETYKEDVEVKENNKLIKRNSIITKIKFIYFCLKQKIKI